MLAMRPALTTKNERAQIQPVIQRHQSGTGFAIYQGNGGGNIANAHFAKTVGHPGKMSPASVVVMASTDVLAFFLDAAHIPLRYSPRYA